MPNSSRFVRQNIQKVSLEQMIHEQCNPERRVAHDNNQLLAARKHVFVIVVLSLDDFISHSELSAKFLNDPLLGPGWVQCVLEFHVQLANTQ